MFLPAEIILLMETFRPVFTEPPYQKALVLGIGTLLAKGRRTVTAARRVLGLAHEGDWAKYHHVLNRAEWEGLAVSALLLRLLVNAFGVCGAALSISVDETLERRWGPQISKRGHWRDSLASSRQMNVTTSGLRWLSVAVVVQLPWRPLAWSLPFLHVLLTTPKVSAARGIRHRTGAERTKQVVCWVRRILPGRRIHLIGDGAYSVIALGVRCRAQGVTLIAPLLLTARLFDPPPAHRPASGKKRRGRPPWVGVRLPHLAEVATLPTTCWHRSRIAWYGGGSEFVDWAPGTALWYSTGTPPLPIRWVLVRDPKGKRKTVAYFSTDVYLSAPAIIAEFVKRWAHEVTFQEASAHLGIETQRQGSDLAIVRTTPALFGLFSLVVLMAHALCPDGQIPLPQAACQLP